MKQLPKHDQIDFLKNNILIFPLLKALFSKKQLPQVNTVPWCINSVKYKKKIKADFSSLCWTGSENAPNSSHYPDFTNFSLILQTFPELCQLWEHHTQLSENTNLCPHIWFSNHTRWYITIIIKSLHKAAMNKKTTF